MKDATDITLLLDRSGSMACIIEPTIQSINKFIRDQKAETTDEAYLTLIQFDDQYEISYEGKKIQDAPALTTQSYVPRGATAYLDALGKTINAVGARLHTLAKSERPQRVVLIIQTDGLENASREYDKLQIKSMIEHQEQVYNWRFIFLGANFDAVKEGAKLGVNYARSMTYAATAAGVGQTYALVSRSMSALRSSKLYNSIDFTDEDRQRAQTK